MGLKSFFAYPRNRRSWVKLGLAGVVSLVFAACISDGPNQTGGEYLGQNGILPNNALYHVHIDAFSVNDFWAGSDVASHLGNTVQLLGTAHNFSATLRVAFNLSDTTFFDSLQDTTSSPRDLRLSLGAQTFPYGFKALTDLVGDSIHGQDSLRFLVQSWGFPDSAGDTSQIGLARLTDAQRLDSINVYNRRFLMDLDSTSLLPKVKALDTITLGIKTIFSNSNRFQNPPLPNLRASIKAAGSRLKWYLQMQVSPIVKPTDTGYAMLRLGGTADSTVFPSLLVGASSVDASNAKTNQRILPFPYGSTSWINYILRTGNNSLALLPALGRGMHFKLDRAKLLDSVDAALRKQGIVPPSHPTAGDFDLTYFIPFGTISLPLADSLRLEGGFPQRVDLASDIDSLVPGKDLLVDAAATSSGNFTTISVPLVDEGASKLNAQPLIKIKDRLNQDKITDTLSLRFCKVSADSTLRRIIFSYGGQDSAFNDTVYMSIGESREVALALPGASVNSPTVFHLTADESALLCKFFIESNSNSSMASEITAVNGYRDPATGLTISDLAKLAPHFLQPTSTILQMRATRGLQRIFNRMDKGGSLKPDFEIKVLPFAAIDTLAVVNGAVSPQYVPYPLLSVIPLKGEPDRLTVSIDLYLYPLKAR